MGDTTKIQWCDYTWNPWRGCTKVSPGCTNCYAEKLVTTRLGGQWGKGKPRQRASKNIISKPHRWSRKPWICQNCGWANSIGTVETVHCCEHCSCKKLRRARVFLGSLMDIFDPEVPIEWFADAMTTVRRCSDLDFLLVTKRPELGLHRIREARNYLTTGGCGDTAVWLNDWLPDMRGASPVNVWLITSTENQEQFDKSVPHLLSIPAIVHGLSCEPLLGQIDFGAHLGPVDLATYSCLTCKATYSGGIDWVIAGGESGPGARVCQVEWLRSIQKQCSAAGVAYFCKQFGSDPRQDLSYAIPESDITDPELQPEDIAAWEAHRHSAPLHLKDKKGGDMEEWPDAKMRVRQWPEMSR